MSQNEPSSPDDVGVQYLSLSSPKEESTRELEPHAASQYRSPRSSSTYTSNINADFQAKLLAFQEQRQSKPTSQASSPLNDLPDPQAVASSNQRLSPASGTSSPVLSASFLPPTEPSAPPLKSPQEIMQHMEQQKRSLQHKIEKDSKPLPPLPPTVPKSVAPSTSKPQTEQQQEASQGLQSSVETERLNPTRPAPSLPINSQVSPQVAARLPKQKTSLSQRRGMKLPGGLPSLSSTSTSTPQSSNVNNNSMPPVRRLASRTNQQSTTTTSSANLRSPTNINQKPQPPQNATSRILESNSNSDQSMQLKGLFANYSKYIDIKSGSLNFGDKLSLDQNGVNFQSGQNFNISAKDLEFIEELGHGNYGTVSKVLHKPSQVVMAMKEVRLELDDSKFRQILMELQVLHNCDSPYIIDFFGAFFVEGAVYMCIEYMDGGSLDKVYGDGIDEAHLQYISKSVILGLKELKDRHNIIHRDVKPTNILVNTKGKVKLCDFGVSGNLVASLARTNIGCQSYMAPERIKSLSPDDTSYSVQSDIWSMGLTILEAAKGCYPYPPETYDNIFSQLSAIVEGPPPKLPESYSQMAIDFVSRCLDKVPDRRPTYSRLLAHPWLHFNEDEIDMAGFVNERLNENNATKHAKDVKDYEELNKKLRTPALHKGGAPKVE